MGTVDKKKVKEVFTELEVSKILKLKKTDLVAFEREGLFDYEDKKKKTINYQNFVRIRVAASLRKDLGVNLEGIDVILAMREKMIRMQRAFNFKLKKVRKKLTAKMEKNLKKLRGKT